MRGRASHVAFLLIVIALPSFAAPEEMVEAIWYPRSFAFDYRSQDVYYSCDELARKVRAILEFLGARRQRSKAPAPTDRRVSSAYASSWWRPRLRRPGTCAP
jgi:hypothetical protein